MKLRKLHIEDYKMFKDFDISFVNENDEALPIVVLAGVNGSGKTSLLEYIYEFSSIKDSNKKTFIETNDFQIDRGVYGINTRRDDFEVLFNKDIVYFDITTPLEGVKESIYLYLHKLVWEQDILASKAFQKLREYIDYILGDLNPQIEFDSQNKGESLFFRNKSLGNKFSIDDLSTGEKTLLSKVLYLYLADIKDKVILIDEPELSLHPSWQNKVFKIYENFALKNNCQIIIATHSPHIIDSAKPEYLRLLKKENNKIVVIQNIDRSYGLEFDKILTDIMGVENLRTPAVAKDIKRLWELLKEEDYESDEYITLYNQLEELLGSLDKDMVLSRLEIARIKSQNVKSK